MMLEGDLQPQSIKDLQKSTPTYFTQAFQAMQGAKNTEYSEKK